ncbi:30S ribosomal protein S6 [Candidatus Falkowbacteria bacterium CG_4_10_14_0_2_um_filter_36_22]|uniref:Small ribosomal subunit protein bS6 n=1 Tax=Candidatus Falkowbacteria bacterium CG02_land_8_20_14_3_00_36_14 TaxID=1974560 RepID=A0A2M7DQW6_9BACT|nr:MAG: 30S ribosomal protein S6 [Candidatus Falkowbacteria bacterium CG02_land_8_20_14_3_00_36_14]PIX10938.1 MAG: 30S ribosomal protein S6 [Candidatus Falkowbacteria bacterium CG_4_8_14_3_um_filter_36_11]PJA11001.1 MAG: 30S ribosomal protein S6 [Candidatus Falkowbacteria bacterium CG_4_10_14_0_2_um_filter_36_22]
MSKTKPSPISHYELLYIISNEYTEKELNPIIEKVKNLIKDNEGNITYGEEWGKKRLAYPIKNSNFGYYNLLEFDLEGKKLSKIDRLLTMMKEVLRHQIVIKKKKTALEINKEKIISEKIAAKKIAEEKTNEEKENKEKTKNTDKINLDDLDKKLDKILNTDDLL